MKKLINLSFASRALQRGAQLVVQKGDDMKLISLLVTILFLGCSGNTLSTSSSLGIDFSLKPGQQTLITGEDLNIEFMTVSNDSRCPVNTQCVTAGNAELQVTMRKTGNDPSTLELNTAGTPDLPDQAEYLNYTIRLKQLQPEPRVDTLLMQSDYLATFVVTKQ